MERTGHTSYNFTGHDYSAYDDAHGTPYRRPTFTQETYDHFHNDDGHSINHRVSARDQHQIDEAYRSGAIGYDEYCRSTNAIRGYDHSDDEDDSRRNFVNNPTRGNQYQHLLEQNNAWHNLRNGDPRANARVGRHTDPGVTDSRYRDGERSLSPVSRHQAGQLLDNGIPVDFRLMRDGNIQSTTHEDGIHPDHALASIMTETNANVSYREHSNNAGVPHHVRYGLDGGNAPDDAASSDSEDRSPPG